MAKVITLPLCYLDLTRKEEKMAKEFIEECQKKAELILDDFMFSFDSSSGIGIGVTIHCPKTNDSQDITDYSRW